MKTTSAPIYASAFIETMAFADINGNTVTSLEDAFANNFLGLTVPENRFAPEELLENRQLCHVVPVANLRTMAQELAAFHERRKLADAKWLQKSMLHTNFGRWLQNDEKAIVADAKKALEPDEDGNVSIADRLGVLPYVIEKIRGRKAWKDEQNIAQAPENYADTSLDYDLPPRTKGRSHAPAYYSITGPSGRTIDLSKPHGAFKAILSSNPNDAFRRFITRLGVDQKGGETELLNLLLKADKVEWVNANGEYCTDYRYLPSYVSSMKDGVWFVMVGWRLNPKCQFGSYRREAPDGSIVMPFVENAKGELEPFIQGVHLEGDILTTSQLDYKLLCEDSGMAITDKNEDIVDYMNESEELVDQGMIRDDDHADEEVDNFLLTQAASEMDRMIDLRVGSAVWLMEDFEPTVWMETKRVGAQCRVIRKRLKEIELSLAEFVDLHLNNNDLVDGFIRDKGKELAKEREHLQRKLTNTRANYRLASEDLKSQTRQTMWADTHSRECIGTPRSSAFDAFSAPLPATVNVLGDHPKAGSNLTVIPGASNEPRNVVVLAAPKITEVDRIAPTCNPLQLLQNGLTRVVKHSDGTYSTRIAAKAHKAITTPKTATPALKLTLLRMMLGGSPLHA